MDAAHLLRLKRSRRQFLWLGAGLIAAACKSGGSGSGLASAPTQPLSAATETTRSEPTAVPTATSTARPQAIEVRGSDAFKTWTQQALDLLRTKASPEFQLVSGNVLIIESVTAGSGMVVAEKRFKVGDQTAYASGHPPAQQLIWYAGTIVHDANHSALYARGQPHSGKDAEVACLTIQKQALLKIETNSYFSNYVQGLIDGANDPANQYWNQATRHW